MVDVKWIESNANEVIIYLGSSEKGLNEEEVKKRIERYGYNEIEKKRKKSIFSIFLNQFKSPLIYLLMFAAFISYLSGEITDTYVILAILFVNSLIGTYHEANAINSIKALENMVKGKAKVIREGKLKIIDAKDVVPGDIIIFEEGDKIIADARIIEENGLVVNESTLTGESIGVKKNSEPCEAKKISEMKNMLFTSTFIIRGEAKAVVVATGNNTEIGKLYRKIEEKEVFPVKEKMDSLTKNLAKFVISGVFIVFAISSLFLGYDAEYILKLLLAQAVSFIPEGLPIVVTIAMALSAYDMAKKKAVIKKLEAIEAMGRIDYLCIDKTGTVTENKIKMSLLQIDGKTYEIKEKIYEKGKIVYPFEEKNLVKAFEVVSLCNKAKKGEKGYIGDPLEVAIYEAMDRVGLEKEREILKEVKPIVEEIPFDSKNKYMMTVSRDQKNKVYLKAVKGAPEKIVFMCNRIIDKEKIRKMTKEDREVILKKVDKLAEKGYRTLSIAYDEKNTKDKKAENLIFIGTICFEDPIRESAKIAINDLERAGIKVMMITGDHKLTAKAVAEKIGLKGKVLEEDELFSMEEKEIEKNIENVGVIARASIEGKMRIIQILKKKNYRVAMTGDGVNDALALKKADVGISLATATDVAKEASDVLLLDDNIENIYNAIEEGRKSIINIKKTIRYLFSTNASEVVFLLSFIFSPLFGINLKYPLTATQILYVNLVTDGLTDVAIAAEKKENELKRHKPSYFRKSYFSKEVKNFIKISTIVSLVGLFLVFFLYENDPKVGTMIFTTLAFMQLFTALSSRKIYPVNDIPNKFLLVAIIASIIIQFIVLYWEPAATLMKVVSIEWYDWIVVIGVSSSLFFVHEIAKRKRITI